MPGQRAHAVAVERDVRAGQRAIAVDVGAEHVAQARRPSNRSIAAASVSVDARVQPCVAISGVPSASSRTSSASVSRSAPNSASHVRHELGVADGQAADDGSRRDVERLLEARARPDAAAELHVDTGRLAHAADQSAG